ncbi:MAG: hypothetical protein IJA97_02110 [Clostridia bacterium]|nr:hypothetical protein [Clostridia bacterium]
MPTKENVHAGHRERLREKFNTGKELFKEHELLELLLGYSIARKDTNALAHNLISRFGSLNGVLSAPTELLKQVDGVGERTASLISLVGYVSTLNQKEKKEKTKLNNIATVKELAIELFKGLDHEVFYMFYLDQQKRILGSTLLDDGNIEKVGLDFDKFTKSILVYKPKSVIVLHNHFAKYPYPSEADDQATAKICAFLNFHKVSLFDHVIVSGEEIYSYFYDNRLQSIKQHIKDKLFQF